MCFHSKNPKAYSSFWVSLFCTEENDKQFDTCPHCGYTIIRVDHDLMTTRVKIAEHKSSAKGRKYRYGRIQLSVPEEWIGLTAWIYVGVPKRLATEEERKIIESIRGPQTDVET